MVGFDPAVRHLVGVGHRHQPGFPFGAQVQVVLVELAQQLPAAGAQLLLQSGVVQGRGLRAFREVLELDETSPAVCERVGGLRFLGHWNLPSLGVLRRSRRKITRRA